MDDYLLRPAARLHAEGWNTRQLRQAVGRGELTRMVRGVYGTGGELTGAAAHVARCRAILLRKGTSVVLSHHSAAIVHGLPVQEDDPPLVHLTVPPPTRGRRRSGYHIHVAALDAEDVVERQGLQVTSLARTAADLARSVSFAWGVIGADAALHRGVGREELAALAEHGARLAGAERLRSVAAFADGRAESPLESASRVTMARAGLPAPELQVVLSGESGWVATSDFGWAEYGVVGEADGAGKFAVRPAGDSAPQKAAMATLARDELIRQAGWWPSHWGWSVGWDVHRLGEQLRGAFRQPRARRRDG